MHSRSRQTNVTHGLLLTLGLLLLTGCQVLFGDFVFEKRSNGAGGSGQVGVGGNANLPSTCDTDGTYRCNGSTREVCAAKLWTPEENCGTAAQCDADHARCRPCAPKSVRCSAFRLERCLDSGEGWSVLEECASADYCDAANERCTTCAADQAFCSGPRLNVCGESRMAWDVTLCDNANLCSTISRRCRPCVAGEYQCSQNVLQRCSDTQEWVTADECGSNELCQASLSSKAVADASNVAWNGNCEVPRCPKSGDFRCNPDSKAQLQTCPPSLMKWEDVGLACLTPALCDAAAGKCKDGCIPGSYKCDGAQLRHCSPDGTKYIDDQLCASAAQCSAAKQSCLPCVTGELQCNGTKLLRCTAAQSWETLAACVTNELCQQSVKTGKAECTPPGCTPPNTQQCGGADKSILQTCPPSQLGWVDKDDCATPGLCDKGLNACIPPICDYAGQPRCDNQRHAKCDANRKFWVTDATCASNQICDVTQGCLGQCPTPPQRCTDVQPEVCTIDPTTQTPVWNPKSADKCPTKELCIVSGGQAGCGVPTCTPAGKYKCDQQSLTRCNAGQTAWDPVKTCTSTQICDDKAVPGQCDNCAAKTYSCSGSSLWKCSDDGQTQVEVATKCVGCDVSADKLAGNCYVCNPTDKRCSGTNQVQSCSADRKSWTAAATCPNAYDCQAVDGFKDYCVTCPTANRLACATTASPGSTHVCSSDRKSWINPGPCSQGYGCVIVDDPSKPDYCASACSPGQTVCASPTSVHTCLPDGKGWVSDPISECADSSGQKACASGVLSGKVACPAETSHCVAGKCLECLEGNVDCANSTTREVCSGGSWVPESCDANTKPYCVGSGTCAECNDSTVPFCLSTSTRKFCANNSFSTEICPAGTPHCQSGSCVVCTSTSPPICESTNVRKYCSGTSWSTQTCTGTTPACYEGSCSECNADTPATCASPTEIQTCVAGSPAKETCSTGACAGGKCVGCNDQSTTTCASDTARQVCVNNAWEQAACPTDKPVCVGNQCVECANSDWICDTSANNVRRHCVANVWETATCTLPNAYCSSGSCVACLPDNTGCASNQRCEIGNCVDAPAADAGSGDGG